MRTAIFGGTFDPIHRAHLVVAREAADTFHLDRVLFVPAANPPHKEAGTPFEHRYKMVELACRSDTRFVPSRIEEGREKSYSILTVERLLAQENGKLFFLIGADAFADIRTWFRWRELIRLVEFIVVTRPGHSYHAPEEAVVHRLDTVALPVSSSDIRASLALHQAPPELTPEVAEYIWKHELYQNSER